MSFDVPLAAFDDEVQRCVRRASRHDIRSRGSGVDEGVASMTGEDMKSVWFPIRTATPSTSPRRE